MSNEEEINISHTEIPVKKQRIIGRPFKPGQSGNPLGKPVGLRNKFSGEFIESVAKEFARRGEKVLKELDATEFVRVCCTILPKVVELDDESKEVINNLAKSLPFDAIHTKITELPKPEPSRLN